MSTQIKEAKMYRFIKVNMANWQIRAAEAKLISNKG